METSHRDNGNNSKGVHREIKQKKDFRLVKRLNTLIVAAIQNSLEFEKTRIFTCGSNIYAKPELLGGKSTADQNTAGDSAKGGHFKQEITAMRSIVGNSSSTDCSDEIAFSILEDDHVSGKSGVSSSKRPENIKTINAKIGFIHYAHL